MVQFYSNKFKFQLLSIVFIVCQFSFAQTSNLWVTLKPNAGGTSQVNEDITINNGFTIVDKSSSSVSCLQSTINNDLVYAITFNGSDVDKDGVNDPISFNLRIKGHKGATYNYSATANASSVSNYGTQSDVTVINNSWGVFGDYDVDAGESLVYTIENVVINGLSTAFKVKSKFTKVDVFETNGGRDHLMIFGFGSNLPSLEIDSNKSLPLSNNATFSITGAGSFYAGIREWAISTLTLNIKISGPDTTTLDLTDYSSFENGPTFYHDYPAQTVQKSKLPNFSWNKVPRWVAARNSEAFSEQQIKDIANNYQLIILEKANYQGFEYIEDGIKNAATRLKAVNPKLTTLFYYNTYINYFGYKANIEYNQNAAAWSTYETNPTTGEQQIYLFKDLYYWYNQDVEGMRNWWINTCVEMANHEAIDGVFVDKISNPNDHGDAFDTNGNPVNNYVKMLNDLHNQLPANKLLVGNTLRNERAGGERDIMEIMDGSYLERWQLPSTGQSDADAVAVSIQLMREALQKGKMINLQSGPNATEEDPLPTDPAELLAYTKQKVHFPLAVFLIIAEENAYFGYNAGVDAKSSSGNLWDTSFIDEFHYFLGHPLGEATKNGYIYERSFENLDLWVNIETKETVFHWKDKTLPQTPNATLNEGNEWYHNYGTNEFKAATSSVTLGTLVTNENNPTIIGNNSTHVSKFIKDSGTHSSIKFILPGNLVKAEMAKFKIRVYTPTNSTLTNNNLRMILRKDGSSTNQLSKTIPITTFDSWVDYTFDFSDLSFTEGYYNEVNLFFASPDTDTDATGNTYYFDAFQGPSAVTLTTNDFELNNASIVAYPNPVTNSFQIDSSINIENVKLYNITGRLLKIFNAKAKYDISDLATGMYIANIKTEFGSKSLRIVKK